ncbi:polysaccharide deacetylase family protein [Humitalea sp. 24SJ18S-53]|uniref:polysaccharide deacetylase family protein n=1 Tax=Humitalea sp. 24SJ18S-53 TaxID=3422307 RepID=UPI003D679C43
MTKLATDSPYPRDFVGYGPTPPDPLWPNAAKVALSFVLNYEEGAENTVLNGDAGSEQYLHEVPGGASILGERSVTIESQFGYGARSGVWRVLRLFAERGLPLTIYACGRALELNPAVARAFIDQGHEVACHGWRWIDYHDVDAATERAHIAQNIEAVTRLCGVAPVGWYTGRVSPQTRALVAEREGFLYDSDSYEDDLPYYVPVGGKPRLIIPYTLDANDMKFAVAPGFASADGFGAYLRDGLDLLRGEGGRMMSVGLHGRIVGRPARAAALARFLDHVVACRDIWVARRADIARHWWATHPPAP